MSALDSDQLDVEDMVRLAGGYEAALNDLMERNGKQLFHFLLRALQNEEDASDVAQEVFARVYHNRKKFDPHQKFLTWIYAIAGNLVKDRYRWRSRHPHVSLEATNEKTGEDLREVLPGSEASPSDSAEAEERRRSVRQAVAALPEEIRLPLILAEYEGRSHAEIGEILGCTSKAVETRIYRARQRLRQSLASFMAEA